MQHGTMIMRPKLRHVETHPTMHHGRPALLLRDPLRLTDRVLIVPQALVPLLLLCDGTHDVDGIQAALAVRFGLPLSREQIEGFLQQLDEALMLENGRFAQAQEKILEAYRSAPYRTPALAGSSYPADPEELRRYLQSFQDQVPSDRPAIEDGRGLVSPHIDYQRGGPIYAQVWSRAAEMVRQADLAIIFGTDHNGSFGTLTLTRQNYATPFGVLPTATDVVGALAAAIGPERAFAEELHHRGEHSIELAAVWLHHVREGRELEIVPILCGSFHHFITGITDPGKDPTFAAVVKALRDATAGRQVIVVAAADLAHIGPAFGDPQPIDWAGKARLQAADEMLIQAICQGDAEEFFRLIRAEGDRRRICGLPPIYMTLRFLGGAQGELTGYDRCPADMQGTSFVSVCGVVFR